jgi:CelD/BcsL family acetyltransferase involved in cellulose biosynthesis
LEYDEHESLCGVAALAADSEGKEASFLSATTGDYCDFLSSPEDKPAFVVAVLAELRKQGIGNVILANLPADSGTVATLRNASPKSGYRCFTRNAYVCEQVLLSQLKRRPGEGRPVLPRKKMLRRLLSIMGRKRPIRLDHARSWDVVEPLLPQFIHAHVGRFLLTGRISNMAYPERRTFLEELAKLLCERGWLVLTRMVSGGDIFAWNYGFQFCDTWFWYQPTFNTAVEKHSPGFCLLAKLIEEAADSSEIKVVDLGLGAEDYKNRFSNQTRETLYVELNASPARHWRSVFRYHAVEMVSASRKAEAAARAMRYGWRNIRQRIRQEGTGAWLLRLGRRLRDLLWSEVEVFFYEWRSSATVEAKALRLQTLGLSELASATLQYAGDDATIAYLLRAVDRLREENAQGFGLIEQGGTYVHFAWVTAFDGFFLSELGARVNAPSPDSVMLFDCWTPPAERGHGYYGQAIALVARRMQEKGKKPWIFSAAANDASVRGLARAGFQRRYSLICQRVLWWQRVRGKAPTSVETPAAEVSA